MTNKKADFKFNEDDVVNTCWICGRQFLAKGIMSDPVCPECEKERMVKVPRRGTVPPNTGSHVKPVDNPALKIELSDEYQYNHLQEAMEYALKEKGFIKADSGKLQWSLLPFKELEDVVRVLMLGAKKYTPDNWKKCDDVTRYKDALMRHVISYVSGDTTDNESHLSHLAHAVCNCLFLMYFDNTKGE